MQIAMFPLAMFGLSAGMQMLTGDGVQKLTDAVEALLGSAAVEIQGMTSDSKWLIIAYTPKAGQGTTV